MYLVWPCSYMSGHTHSSVVLRYKVGSSISGSQAPLRPVHPVRYMGMCARLDAHIRGRVVFADGMQASATGAPPACMGQPMW